MQADGLQLVEPMTRCQCGVLCQIGTNALATHEMVCRLGPKPDAPKETVEMADSRQRAGPKTEVHANRGAQAGVQQPPER